MIGTCIILDGWHQGHVVTLPIQPSIKLLRPKVTTDCNCGDTFESYESQASVHEYKLTFLSLDHKWALYTTDGNPERIADRRDWVTKPGGWTAAPLYFDCRHEKAWPMEEER